ERAELGRHGHPALAVELDSRHERRPVPQVIACLDTEGVLRVLALRLELELLFGPQGQASVCSRRQVSVFLEVGPHARREDHPALDIERAGEVPDELETWRQSNLRSHCHWGSPPRVPTSRHSMVIYPHPSTTLPRSAPPRRRRTAWRSHKVPFRLSDKRLSCDAAKTDPW